MEKPPYDIEDDGDSINAVLHGYGLGRTTGGTVSFTAFLPAGILRLLSSAAAQVAIDVTVIDEVLCKDMA